MSISRYGKTATQPGREHGRECPSSATKRGSIRKAVPPCPRRTHPRLQRGEIHVGLADDVQACLRPAAAAGQGGRRPRSAGRRPCRASSCRTARMSAHPCHRIVRAVLRSAPRHPAASPCGSTVRNVREPGNAGNATCARSRLTPWSVCTIETVRTARFSSATTPRVLQTRGRIAVERIGIVHGQHQRSDPCAKPTQHPTIDQRQRQPLEMNDVRAVQLAEPRASGAPIDQRVVHALSRPSRRRCREHPAIVAALAPRDRKPAAPGRIAVRPPPSSGRGRAAEQRRPHGRPRFECRGRARWS